MTTSGVLTATPSAAGHGCRGRPVGVERGLNQQGVRMNARDRVVELRRIPASKLRPHPHNWRSHPPAQRAALAGVLAEVGFAGALLVRPLAEGDFELIDGLRQFHAGYSTIPTQLDRCPRYECLMSD